MNERLFQFIWEHLLFDVNHLQTLTGEAVSILHQGTLNSNQGPDFLNARIRIGTTTWVGNVELHLLNSDWYKHKHSGDPQYDNVILHVILKQDGEPLPNIPTLCLEGRISKLIVQRYADLHRSPEVIPCSAHWPHLPDEVFRQAQHQALMERWRVKRGRVMEMLEENRYHFEEVFWWLLAANFGVPVNQQAFLNMAQSIPFKLIQLYNHDIVKFEALLMGQAGMLDGTYVEAYPKLLCREYQFLQRKHALKKSLFPVQFLRMRPASFPTIRLAQLAALMHNSKNLFAMLREAPDLKTLMQLLHCTAGDYWSYHYRLDEPATMQEKSLGMVMIQNITANTILPLMYVYGGYVRQENLQARAVDWLRELPPENNNITRLFSSPGFENNDAFDSQSLVFLKKEYCDKRKCLNCPAGVYIMGKT